MFYSYLKILLKRNFFLLWFGQVISQFGDRLTIMALIGLVYKIGPKSPFSLAKMFSLAVIPVFLISPVAGVYIDRWNKQKTMFVSDFLRALLIFSIPFILFKFNSLIVIYIFIFLSFCVGRFFLPAKMAIIPSLVDKENLFMANSLVSITAMIAAIFGLVLGGLIVEFWGVKSAFTLDAATFFISALCIIFMRIKEKAEFKPNDILKLSKDALLKVKKSIIFDTREGIKYILKSSETQYVTKIKIILFAAIGSLYTVFIVFIQDIFNTVTKDLAGVAVGTGAGLFIGTLVYGHIGLKTSVKKIIYLSLIFSCLWLVIFVSLLRMFPYKIFAFLSCFLLGITCSPIEIALNSLIHHESENEFLGRIFSSLEVILHLSFIIFMFLASYLAEIMSPFTIIVAVGIIIILFSTYSLFAERKQL